ncbi:MAG: hypothetical protein QM820_65365 [Minicystis sp.]
MMMRSFGPSSSPLRLSRWILSAPAGLLALATITGDAGATTTSRDGGQHARIQLDKSENSRVPVDIKFVNRRPASVNVLWVDFQGVEKSYGVLQPGGEMPMHTYVRHLWVFRDANGGEVWRWYAPSNRVSGVITID